MVIIEFLSGMSRQTREDTFLASNSSSETVITELAAAAPSAAQKLKESDGKHPEKKETRPRLTQGRVSSRSLQE